MKVLLIAFLIVFAISPLFRCIVKHLHLTILYGFVDAFLYVKYKKWEDFNLYGIDMFCGMFGHGKTLSMTHRARLIYNKYGDRVRFISNYPLKGIPYIELLNFQQIVDIADNNDSQYEGTVVLIDEIENVLNNRNFAKFPLSMLHTINQQRKCHVYFLCSSPRYFMVDKLFRTITTHVYMCDKFWRFQHVQCFDAWDLENSMNTRDIKRLSNNWWFVKNQDYKAYETENLISKYAAEQFISNEEALNRIGEKTANIEAVTNQSKAYKRRNNPKHNKK